MSEKTVCDRCGGPTREKRITSKKNGREYVLKECVSGCMKGNFPYSFFPSKPKDEAGSSAPARPASNGNDAQVMALLIEAVSVLKDIRQILANPGRIHVTEDELQPDREVPFET